MKQHPKAHLTYLLKPMDGGSIRAEETTNLDTNKLWLHGLVQNKKRPHRGASGANPVETAAAVKLYDSAISSGVQQSNIAITTYRVQAFAKYCAR